MKLNSISFGRIVKINDNQSSVDRKAALVADLANGNEKKYTGRPHRLIAKEIKDIFDDIKPSDKSTSADVLYLGEETYVVSGEDAKKTKRLEHKYFETKNNFYFNQLEQLVKKSLEPFSLLIKVGGNKKSTVQKIQIDR